MGFDMQWYAKHLWNPCKCSPSKLNDYITHNGLKSSLYPILKQHFCVLNKLKGKKLTLCRYGCFTLCVDVSRWVSVSQEVRRGTGVPQAGPGAVFPEPHHIFRHWLPLRSHGGQHAGCGLLPQGQSVSLALCTVWALSPQRLCCSVHHCSCGCV